MEYGKIRYIILLTSMTGMILVPLHTLAEDEESSNSMEANVADDEERRDNSREKGRSIGEGVVQQESPKVVVDRILSRSPIIDGHNDLAWNYKVLAMNDLRKVDLNSDLTTHPYWYLHNETHTDIPRLRASGYGGQFWSAYTDCKSQLKDSVEQTLEQIDVIKRFVNKYPKDFYWATSVKDIEEAIKENKIASLIGVEGGHSIQSNYGILRMYYDLGVRYMTLTHFCNTPWADSSPVDTTPIDPDHLLAEHNGLSEWGLGVVDEMNRLGMIVDLSHVSAETMRDALRRSKAPVMFSHSGARTVYDHHRNVPDDVLILVKSTDSIVMLNLYSGYLKKEASLATIDDVIAHADHIYKIAGADHIGIGADFDGVDVFPPGLENVSKLRHLLEALYATGRWKEEDLEKMTSKNILRVFSKVEQIRDSLGSEPPKEDPLPVGQYWNEKSLTAKYF